MGNNNKRKKLTGCVVGAIMLLLVAILAACSKDNTDNVEAAGITEDVNTVEIDEAMSGDTPLEQDTKDIAENETEQAESEEANTEEPDTEEPDAEESDTEETVAEEPTENTETSAESTNTETTEPTANGTITTVSNWGTPQEYNGDPEGKGPGRIIVKGYDYDNVWGDMTWKGEYWTASNGVEIKIISVIDHTGGTGMFPVPDGVGKDNEPTSPFQIAMAEASGVDIYGYNADLNITLPLATYKRTDIDINDANIVAYRNAYDYKLCVVNGLPDSYRSYQYGDPVNMRLAFASDGVAEFDEVGARFWEIFRKNDYWEVRLNANPAEFRWDGIHQILRYLSPDGDSLYQLFYDDWYFGRFDVLPEYDEWYSYQNSQVMVKDTENLGYGIYYFK